MSTKRKASAKTTATVRSRTGCQTCRSRKLKCDEQRPICGQCQKSHRECVRSEPITFRHHQNSSFGKDGQDHNLDSFFKYAQTYSEEEKRGFLPVPKELTWVPVDPTAEDPDDGTPPSHPATTTETYQQVAAHTLEALSTAAADQPTSSFPPQGTAYYTAANPQSGTHPEYGFVTADSAGATNSGLPSNMNYFLTNSTTQLHTDTSLIDPNLEATDVNGAGQVAALGVQQDDNGHAGNSDGQEDGMAESESRLAITLRNFNQLQA